MNWLARLVLRFLPRVVVPELPDDAVQAAINRGRRAETILQDEVLLEAFSEIETKLSEQWRSSSSASHEVRERLFHQVAALQSVRSQLKRWSEDAVFLADRLEKAAR